MLGQTGRVGPAVPSAASCHSLALADVRRSVPWLPCIGLSKPFRALVESCEAGAVGGGSLGLGALELFDSTMVIK